MLAGYSTRRLYAIEHTRAPVGVSLSRIVVKRRPNLPNGYGTLDSPDWRLRTEWKSKVLGNMTCV